MKASNALALVLIVLLTSGCQEKVCPAGSITYLSDPGQFPPLSIPPEIEPAPTPSLVEIAGKMIAVDRVINGPLCNDTWRGTVYVGCDVQVMEWAEDEPPTFFDKCDLSIEPGTTVYVAAHNDAAYYNGCSCHTRTESR